MWLQDENQKCMWVGYSKIGIEIPAWSTISVGYFSINYVVYIYYFKFSFLVFHEDICDLQKDFN